MSPLDVLLIESHPGNGAHEAAALTREGHTVHRCHEPGSAGFPCTEITSPGSCPLDRGVDVALLVRRLTPHATDLEQGVSCALRAGVPVIEDGPAILDPFEPYLAGRVSGGLIAACEDAAAQAWGPLREAILDRTAGVLASEGIDPGEVAVSFRRAGVDLHIELAGPPMSTSGRQALGVRVLDALRTSDRTFGQVDVSYTDATTAGV